jgi:hypothetical protein
MCVCVFVWIFRILHGVPREQGPLAIYYYAGFLFGLFFHPEDGDDMFL